MKKLFCLVLALALMLSAAAMAEGALKERRPDLEGAQEDVASMETSEPAANGAMVTDPKLVDIAGMDDYEVGELYNRVDREMYYRSELAEGTVPASGSGTMIIDQDGVRMEIYEPELINGILCYDARVENNSGLDLSLDIVLAEVNGESVTGYGFYSIYAGESSFYYISFVPNDDAAAAALLAPESLRFTIWAYEDDSYSTYFTTDVTL